MLLLLRGRRAMGTVRQVLGSSFVDIELSMEERELALPPLHSVFQTVNSHLLVETIKDLGKFTYRAVPISDSTEGLARGEEAYQVAITLPSAQAALGRIVDVMGRPVDDKGPLPLSETVDFNSPPPLPSFFCPMEQLITGIKAIDLLCPLVVGGKNGLVGFPGKTTLMRHLIDTLQYDLGVYCAIASRTGEIRDFVELGLDKVAMVNCGMGEPVGARARALQTAARMAHNTTTKVALFVDDLSRWEEAVDEMQAAKSTIPQFQEAFLSNGKITSIQCLSRNTKELVGALDSTVILSLDRANRGLFPAVDPFQSQSSLMDATFLGERHVEIANAVVAMLHRERELLDFAKTTGMVEDFTDEAKLALLASTIICQRKTCI
ncbi:hypothetical protein BASA81_003968 [Batrachochytrium salamandrivorans]|nr:hypothetical protein BASA81_003968 [Batrachochytrium salamandrivorans]